MKRCQALQIEKLRKKRKKRNRKEAQPEAKQNGFENQDTNKEIKLPKIRLTKIITRCPAGIFA